MIEKLDKKMEFYEISVFGDKKAECLDFEAGRKLNSKINELVDAVNELQAKVNKLEVKVNFAKPEVKETFVCPEQYKWIGKLCKFWDYANKPVYGILDDVDVDNKEYPYTKLGGNIFQNCEPVKPDDDIIYKGGDNE